MAYGALKRRLAHDLDGAFPDLVGEFQGTVYTCARRLAGTDATAEDIAQEVFVRAYRALDGYPAKRIMEMRLPGWLATITLNLCRNHARSRRRRPLEVPLDRAAEPASADGADVAALIMVGNDEWRQRLGQLSGPMRAAVVLRHVVGLSYLEIGEMLDRPPGTVKSDVHRALVKLRAIITTEDMV